MVRDHNDGQGATVVGQPLDEPRDVTCGEHPGGRLRPVFRIADHELPQKGADDRRGGEPEDGTAQLEHVAVLLETDAYGGAHPVAAGRQGQTRGPPHGGIVRRGLVPGARPALQRVVGHVVVGGHRVSARSLVPPVLGKDGRYETRWPADPLADEPLGPAERLVRRGLRVGEQELACVKFAHLEPFGLAGIERCRSWGLWSTYRCEVATPVGRRLVPAVGARRAPRPTSACYEPRNTVPRLRRTPSPYGREQSGRLRRLPSPGSGCTGHRPS
ncbi:hypothetical protein SLI_8103 [Streptomyces lividans 1326]|uniref:Uncharacterized protein n=1 Tax=Streptomyces lividans 1326 TaxID=1200984 RepID=A0A7U9DZ23_STRLI|nr:hypothetical protein SLI_8103 [Streptomyces lividans 1326]